ncbi:MAG: D-alanyl-D-alanine carboxypeptidase [Eubacterium sp.]|nr:D-alanyl-D-alanine carboxypeptidase [Eubacterium sp.]
MQINIPNKCKHSAIIPKTGLILLCLILILSAGSVSLASSNLSGHILKESTGSAGQESGRTDTDGKGDSLSGNAGFQSQAKSALLMEASTGTILYEKDADSRRPPASITKIMTLLLIFDAMESGSLKAEDSITVSEHAASMGGSQVFLEAGESQTADTMIKCIAVSSANDACVAMAEHIAGSEEAFVDRMNQRAQELGMTSTHFVNCCGLDADGHYTSARDVALMSRELIKSYPQVFNYTGIWMDTITHVTRRGSSEFGLSNTNKLIRQYEGATGLKTGSTGKAGFCLSGTAKRDEVSLIAVVMGCESGKARVAACSALLDYGFANCRLYKDDNPPSLPDVRVSGGRADRISCRPAGTFSCVIGKDTDLNQIRKEVNLTEEISAPVKAGQSLGTLSYYLGEEKLGEVEIISENRVDKARYGDCAGRLLDALST